MCSARISRSGFRCLADAASRTHRGSRSSVVQPVHILPASRKPLACSSPSTGRTAGFERTWAKHAWAKIWRSGSGHLSGGTCCSHKSAMACMVWSLLEILSTLTVCQSWAGDLVYAWSRVAVEYKESR